MKNMPYEHSDNVWVSVTIEMSLDLIRYDRKLYTSFDVLSDIGGLSGMIFYLFAVILKIWNYNAFDNYMVSRLFRLKKTDEERKASHLSQTSYFA